MMKKSESGKPRVVIVGAGFAGLYCAKKLAKSGVNITIVDRRNFHLFQPLLYQVASGSLSPGDIASPIRTEFTGRDNVTVLLGEVTNVDVREQRVRLASSEEIAYDYLVVATGSHHHYFGNDHWSKYAPGLKSIENALEMRSRILRAFELAEAEPGGSVVPTFVIVGGGPTGVELAGTIGELAHSTMRGEFRRTNPAKSRILLVENDNRVLPMYGEKSSAEAKQFLTELGVELRLETQVTNIGENEVELSSKGEKETLQCENIFWAAGNKASGLAKVLADQLGCEVDRAGRIMVDAHLNPASRQNIFVLGDMANVPGEDGKPLPGVAPVAMQEGRYTAESILRDIKGKSRVPFKYFNKGSLAVVGRNRAVAERNNVRFAGIFAWLMWVFIHIAYLIEFQNRTVVLFRWAITYFTRKRGARLITGEGLEHPVNAEQFELK